MTILHFKCRVDPIYLYLEICMFGRLHRLARNLPYDHRNSQWLKVVQDLMIPMTVDFSNSR